MRKLKILYINTLYHPHIGGGAEITIKSLVEGLQRRGHEVVALATGPTPGLHREEVDGVRVWRAGIENHYWQHTQQRPNPLVRLAWHWRDRYNDAMSKHLRVVLEMERPDIVSCHNLAGWSISAWDEIKAAGIPVVQVLHDLYLLCPRSTMFKQGQACQRQCRLCSTLRTRHPAASTRVDAVVGVSKYVLERLRSNGYFGDSRPYVIHNARQIPDPGKKEPAAGAPLRFGYIGTLAESKGLEWLIGQFLKLDIPATLVIAGKGQSTYERHLKTLVDHDRIKLLGYVPARDFFPQVDVCIVPSIWPDTFPGVAFESCAYHVPVVAAANGGLPEIVRHEENGLLIDSDNPDSLGEAIQRLVRDRELLSRITTQARPSVLPLLDMDRMYSEHESMYLDLLSAST